MEAHTRVLMRELGARDDADYAANMADIGMDIGMVCRGRVVSNKSMGNRRAHGPAAMHEMTQNNDKSPRAFVKSPRAFVITAHQRLTLS